MHIYRPGNLQDEIPKRRRLWPTPGCNAMVEEEEEEKYRQYYTYLEYALPHKGVKLQLFLTQKQLNEQKDRKIID
jgi:hypothetical protein